MWIGAGCHYNLYFLIDLYLWKLMPKGIIVFTDRSVSIEIDA